MQHAEHPAERGAVHANPRRVDLAPRLEPIDQTATRGDAAAQLVLESLEVTP